MDPDDKPFPIVPLAAAVVLLLAGVGVYFFLDAQAAEEARIMCEQEVSSRLRPRRAEAFGPEPVVEFDSKTRRWLIGGTVAARGPDGRKTLRYDCVLTAPEDGPLFSEAIEIKE